MPTHYRGNEGERRALNAYIAMMRAAASVTARLSARRVMEGLTTSRLGVLETLFHLGPMCQKELAAKLLQSGGNITMVVDHLERDGMVCRTSAGGDRRKRIIRLTERGRSFIGEVIPQHVADIVAEMSILTAAEQGILRRLCRTIGKRVRER